MPTHVCIRLTRACSTSVQWLHDVRVPLDEALPREEVFVEAAEQAEAAAAAGEAEEAAMLRRVAAEEEAEGVGSGWTPMHAACAHGQLAVGRWLHKRGAPVACATSRGCTPLHAASEMGQVRSPRLLPPSPAFPDLP